MLISFSVENWQSFRDKATLSMLAGREKQHKERISKIDKYKVGLLPVSAIYGANASGKTKFFNALKFAQLFITKITQPESTIPREYFKLDKKCSTQPSKFSFELLIEDQWYDFSFSVTELNVIEEKLIKVSPSSEKILYHRTGKKILFPNNAKNKEFQRLQFVADGTRDNQLFLTNSVNQRIDYFQSIYEWFAHKLTLISPFSLYGGTLDYSSMNNILLKLDTSISRLDEKNISLDDLQLPEEMQTRLIEDLSEGGQIMVHPNKRIYLIKKDRKLHARKLIPYHKSIDGDDDIPFDFEDESAGTIRMLDLLPAILNLINHKQSKVYFIDEFDHRLHTLMTRNFLETFLRSCNHKNRSQLIFTTHDVLLMDQDILRRDEIWITERNKKGCSSLISFAEYKDVRSDKDIRKSYLQGRLGGIPKILLW